METLKVGSKAPEFCIKDQDKKERCLKQLKGRAVVLYFYPKDNTPGCTLEAVTFSFFKQEFEKAGAIILGISKDSCSSHQKFIDKNKLTIVLLSDPDASVQKLYDVWKPKVLMGKEFFGTVRTTFLIDRDGKIVHIWENVQVKGHVEEVLKHVKSLE